MHIGSGGKSAKQIKMEEMISNVYVADYGDDYHRFETDPPSELEAAVAKIRRRYNDVIEYNRAVVIYKDYMSLVIENNGGVELFKFKLKAGLIREFIPPIPRMKVNQHLKSLRKQNLIVSKVQKNIDFNKVEGSFETLDPNINLELIIDEEEENKKVSKILETMKFDTDLRKLKEMSNIDYLNKFFEEKKNRDKDDNNKKVITLTDIITGDYEDKLPSDDTEDEIIYYQGNYLKRSSVDSLMNYESLRQFGWDPVKIMKDDGVGKTFTKLVKNNGKKKKKKKKKVDDFAAHVGSNGDYDSYEDYEKDMLNVSYNDVFGSDNNF